VDENELGLGRVLARPAAEAQVQWRGNARGSGVFGGWRDCRIEALSAPKTPDPGGNATEGVPYSAAEGVPYSALGHAHPP
jgi:hypothetical protein